ncbi:hypothetical protein JCM3766R1_003569 [Sporobolomyces carnicolor]
MSHHPDLDASGGLRPFLRPLYKSLDEAEQARRKQSDERTNSGTKVAATFAEFSMEAEELLLMTNDRDQRVEHECRKLLNHLGNLALEPNPPKKRLAQKMWETAQRRAELVRLARARFDGIVKLLGVSTLRKHGTLETMVPSATRDLHLVTYQHPSLSDPGWCAGRCSGTHEKTAGVCTRAAQVNMFRSGGLMSVSNAKIRPITARESPRSATTFSTLAPSRPNRLDLASRRSMMNPCLFLLHVSSLSVASCLIPLIGARQASTRAAEPRLDEPSLEPLPAEYPIQQPYPTRNQLLKLSSQLRKQIKAAPLDAAFTLRQLHLVNELPRLHLPDSPSVDLSTLLPERWIWRLPATAALHSIFRTLRAPPPKQRSASSHQQPPHDPSRIAEALLPIALTIARHALEFDTVMWATILNAHGQGSAIEWERLLLRARGQAGGEGLREETSIMTRFDTTERDGRIAAHERNLAEGERRHDALVRRLWGEGFANEMAKTSRPAPLSSRLRQRQMEKLKSDGPDDAGLDRSLPPHLRSFSSIPARTLDELVVYLSQQYGDDVEVASSTLAISASLTNLRVPRSRRALYHSFETSLVHDRPDLAARFFADYLDQVERQSGLGHDQASRMLRQRLAPALRPVDRQFETSPSREVLSAVATLARALDEQWTRGMTPRAGRSGRPPAAVSDLVRLLASFPVAPYNHDLEAGTEEHRLARQHARVYKMVKHVLRRILETVVGRTIHLGSVNSLLGEPIRESRSGAVPLDVLAFNTLISYALTKLQSAELALLVLERMTKQGISPTPATHNIVFTILVGNETPTTNRTDSPSGRALDRHFSSRVRDDYAVPTLVAHMSKTSNFDELEQIVFRLLPELDHRALPPSLHPATPLTPTPPPSTGRNPFLYTTLLHALACAGRVGLAERVFRNGRWAAELSRSHAANIAQEQDEQGQQSPAAASNEHRRRHRSEAEGWVLPPHAFTIMLQMYASEVRRGRRLERRLDPSFRHSPLQTAPTSAGTSRQPGSSSSSSAHVRGWGRHAIRVFLLRSAQAQSTPHDSTFSSPSSSPSSSSSLDQRPSRSKTSPLPRFLRSEAAPIVALYELEGGSKEPELKSLELAMKDERSRESLEILFPGSTRGSRAAGSGRGGQGGGGGGGGEDPIKRRRQKKDVVAERNQVRSQRDRAFAKELVRRRRFEFERELSY